MKVKMEPAVCSGGSPKQTASNNQLTKAYPKAESLSSLKSEIGTLLFCLQFPVGQELRQAGYRLLEILLSARYERGTL